MHENTMKGLNNFIYNNHNSPISTSPSLTSNNSNLSTNTSSSESESEPEHALIGSLRQECPIYSLAAAGNSLFIGSQSKTVKVWRNLKYFSGFKSSSGMVKSIVACNDKIFTGHQDGKIRVWIFCNRVGTLPRTKHLLLNSLSSKKHYDTVSCMSVDAETGLLYSGSWDKTLKVWRISDSKCLETIPVHDDAVNAVATVEGLVFTGSADGTVKLWRRKGTEHFPAAVLLRQEHAVTALAARGKDGTVYAGSSEGLVRFWEVEKGAVAYGGVMRWHKVAVLCLAVAGSLVVSGSADGVVCVWRRSGGGHECAAVLAGHGGPVKCLAAERETREEEGGGRRWVLYSGSVDRSVKIWRVSE